MAKAVRAPRKKANAYQPPDPIPAGQILTDVSKKEWRLGPSIGKGGFGEIYSAQEAASKSKNYPYVVKIEPHDNGPLFVEMHFYIKHCKAEDIEAFRESNKLKILGIPSYLGSGSCVVKDVKYRFVVTEKFGDDVDKLWNNSKKILPLQTVFTIALQLTYVLEYIHKFGYVHADIKGSNILMGTTADTKDQAYLVDFGLAAKFSTQEQFKANPKRAHDGTIEYLSRDAHKGVPTRRGDFEILCYNIIHWLGGRLPWQQQLGDPKVVQGLKEAAMGDVPGFLKQAFGSKSVPDALVKLLKHVNELKFNETPRYSEIKQWLNAELAPAPKRGNKRRSNSVAPATPPRKVEAATPSSEPRRGKQRKLMEDKAKEIGGGVIKKKIESKKVKKMKENALPVNEDGAKDNLEENGEILTDAMKEVMALKDKKDKKRRKIGEAEERVKNVVTKRGKKTKGETKEAGENSEEILTDAMKEVLAKRNKNVKNKNKNEAGSSKDFEGEAKTVKVAKTEKPRNGAARPKRGAAAVNSKTDNNYY